MRLTSSGTLMKQPKKASVREKWRLLNETVEECRECFKDVPLDELHRMIDEAVASVRASKRSRQDSRNPQHRKPNS